MSDFQRRNKVTCIYSQSYKHKYGGEQKENVQDKVQLQINTAE